jgi:hypothetical protein
MTSPALSTTKQTEKPAEQSTGASNSQRSQSQFLSWLPLLICALPSILLLAFVPPTFNMRDSATLLTTPLGFLVPHWPPLYPEMLAINTGIFGYSNAAIYAIVIEQHLLSVAAGIYLTTIFSENWKRLVMAVFFSAANYFFVLSHGLYTEALSTGLLLLFIGAGLRLALLTADQLDSPIALVTVELAQENPRKARRFQITHRGSVLFLSYLSLILMTLTRHNMFIFASLLPSIYLARFILRVKGPGFKTVVGTTSLGILSFFVVQLCNETFCKMLGSDSSAKFGRPAVNRMHDIAWASMTPDEKAHLLGNMMKRCPDDVTRFALNVMIEDEKPWKGSYDKIQAMLPSFKSKKTTDQIMNDAAKAFFMTPNKYLLKESVNAFNLYMGADNSTFASFVEANAPSVALYRNEADVLPQFKGIPLIQQIDVSRYKEISNVINPKLFDGVCRYIPLATIAIAICIVAIAGGASSESLCAVLALCFSAFLYASISAAITVVVPRYLAPVNAIAWLSLAVAITSFRRFPGSNASKGGAVS